MVKTIIDDEQGNLTGSKSITTTIPINIWMSIKKSRTSWNSLILRGWEARNGFDGLTKRANEYESELKNMRENVNRFQKIIFDLNSKIEKMQDVKK